MQACAPSHPVSDHCDGKRFHNVEPVNHGFKEFLQWMWHRDAARWPKWVESRPAPAPASRVDGGLAAVTFVNHATFLIQTAGQNILTDPVWSERAGPWGIAGPKRIRAPGIRFRDLPPIDLVLLSHNHYDHLDVKTLRRLGQRDGPLVISPLGLGKLLRSIGMGRVVELDWWQSHRLSPDVNITLVPARHFSGRTLWDRNATLWGGFVIDCPAGPVYFAGDTGFAGHFHDIARRFNPLRLALLPIGAYEPRWFMSPVHMNPADAVRAHQVLGGPLTLGMHFGTFRLTDEAHDAPQKDLAVALAEAGLARERFRVPGFGEKFLVAGD